MITLLAVLVAIALLVWGFYRARPFGKLGVLAWLQSVMLTVPWLIFFTLFAAGIYLNLVSLLFLFVTAAGLYIYFGNQLRTLAKDPAYARPPKPIANPESGEIPAGKTSSPSDAQPVAEVTEPETIPIPTEDLKAIQGIFGIDTFFATETIPYQEGAIFRGNLRGDAAVVHQRLTESLQERLDNKYRLYLVENQDGKPVVIVLPSSRDPQPMTVAQKVFAGVLLLATIAACQESAGLMLGFDWLSTPNRIVETWPIAVGLLSILAVHELGHWFMANRYQVRLGWPFFIPTLQIGSFGALTRFESILPNRNVLFDIAFAGPAAGGALSLVMLVVGLLLSHQGSLFSIPSEFFQGSILVGALTRVVLRESLQEPIVDVHPLVVLGWLGLVITALNVLPAGQLDGGRIVQAIYGRKVAGRTTIATLILLGLAAFVNPLALYWAVVVFVLQRDLERPCLNELTEPDDIRAALGLLILFLMVMTLVPLSPAVAGRFGIGT
jgi:membrane-associated protease RseP (regulator of RpoE activity)